MQRLVANLVDQEFLDRNDAGYRVGVRMAHWAAPALQGAELVDTARPVLESLRDETGETAALFRESHGYRVCVALAETHKVVRSAMRVGLVLPLLVGSAGHVLLAWDPALCEELTEKATGPGGLAAMTKATVTDLTTLNNVIDETAERGYAISSGERELDAGGVSAPVFSPQGTLLAALNLLGPSTRLTPERYEEMIHPTDPVPNMDGPAAEAATSCGGSWRTQ